MTGTQLLSNFRADFWSAVLRGKSTTTANDDINENVYLPLKSR